MTLAELLEQQAMALPPDERKKLGAKLLGERKRRAISAQAPRGVCRGPRSHGSRL
jgi:hypothetical protein